MKSISRLKGNNEVDVNDLLENDANNLEFEILNDDEIVEPEKESKPSSEIENEYEDAKSNTCPIPSEAFTTLEPAIE